MKITILGAGAYAIALAKMFEKNTDNITIWSKFDYEVDEINKFRENRKLFSGVKISDKTKVTSNLNIAVSNANIIVIAIPTIAIRDTLKYLKKFVSRDCYFLNASKGIEQSSFSFISSIIGNELKTNKYANLSGPTLAIDLANNEKCSLTLASKNIKVLKTIKKYLETDNLSIEEESDVIGTEICGAIKNCFALGAGLLDGLGVSISTKSMYLTKCLNDLKIISYSLGGNKRIINTYSGVGDLIMTCSCSSSRNFHFGYLVGSFKSKNDIDNFKKTKTIEGLYTLKSIKELLDLKKITIPTINRLYDIFYNSFDPNIILE